eukprot:COSAG01_NODE_4994_length_4559_cov_6.934529_7_plen_168_part_00
MLFVSRPSAWALRQGVTAEEARARCASFHIPGPGQYEVARSQERVMKGRAGAGSVTWTQQVPEREAVKRPPIWQPTDLDKSWAPFPDMHAVEYRDPDSIEGKLLYHESTEMARSARCRVSTGGYGMRSNAGAVPTDVRAAPAVGAGAPANGWRAVSSIEAQTSPATS